MVSLLVSAIIALIFAILFYKKTRKVVTAIFIFIAYAFLVQFILLFLAFQFGHKTYDFVWWREMMRSGIKFSDVKCETYSASLSSCMFTLDNQNFDAFIKKEGFSREISIPKTTFPKSCMERFSESEGDEIVAYSTGVKELGLCVEVLRFFYNEKSQKGCVDLKGVCR